MNESTQADIHSESTRNTEVPARPSVLGRIASAAKELGDALSSVLSEIPSASASPQELTRDLGINRALAGRLLSALRMSDPLASVNRMPRSEGLRIFLNAVESRAERPKIERANKALRDFEQILRVELGGWSGLDPVISEWLPDVRGKFEMTNKQGAFRCMSNLKGVQADLELSVAIYYPSDTGRHCDVAAIAGLAGLRRLRPGARFCFGTMGGGRPSSPPDDKLRIESIEENSENELPLLSEFCSKPLPKFAIERSGDLANYILEGEELGPESSMDLYVACVMRRLHPRFRTDPPKRIGPIVGLNVPGKMLIANLLIHEDLCPGNDPELVIYDAIRGGDVNPDDRSRDVDRLFMAESIQSLGKGVERFRASEIAQLPQMTHRVLERLGWDSEKLRGYRCRVRYPIYGAQYCMLLDPPHAPAD